MGTVPDNVLQWLYNSVSEYADPGRTYSDFALVLSQYPSLAPRTEVHTFEDGTSSLLLLLSGTLPVSFRGSTYRFPISIWCPRNYPQEPPMIYVQSTKNMAVRPGQHVSAEGKVYHPYLVHWASHWQMSSVADFLSILADIFAKEPPVVSRQPSQQDPRVRPPAAMAPPVPSRPAEPSRAMSPGFQSQHSMPPPRPPKSPESSQAWDGAIIRPMSNAAPRLPPKQGQTKVSAYLPRSVNGHGSFSPPPQPMMSPMADRQSFRQLQSPQPLQPYAGHASRGYALPAGDDNRAPRPDQNWRTSPPTQQYDARQQFSPSGQNQPHRVQYMPQQHHNYSAREPSQTAKSREPAQDLLSGPLESSLPLQRTNAQSIPAPPIPPNPQKDALLKAIASSLGTQLDQELAQSNAAVPALQAQHAAMLQAEQRMQTELAQLLQLDETLASNEKILHEAMREADRVIESVSQRELPNVDDVLVAPTVVGEQLYGLVADEGSIGEAMFTLTRALDKGRISGDVFVKQTRSLAREQFLKKALIKKIAAGMGLAAEGAAA